MLNKECDIMADKTRRQKDLISRTVDRFKETTSVDYARYFEGSPTYITYYQLDDLATQQDTALENVHSLMGNSSPNKYKKIQDVVIYGVDALSISNEINDRGLESLISGDFVLLPDSIRPYPGDFFVFDENDLQEHIFRVNDVQYDKASPKKFFRCLFALYPDNAGLIFDNVIEDYVLDYQNKSGENYAVVKKADAVVSDKIKLMVDSIIDRYRTLFYDEDMDTFVCNTGSEFLWNPYIQKFVHDTGILTKYEEKFMEEIYINNIEENLNPAIFSDQAYYNSIYTRVLKELPLTFTNSFLSYEEIYDLKQTRNLPFFHGTMKYVPILVHKDNLSYFNNFHLLYQDKSSMFKNYPDELKFATGSEVDVTSLEVGTIFYELDSSGLPMDIYQVKMVGSTKTAVSISFAENVNIEGELFYNIISRYLVTSKTDPRYLVIDEALLLEINNTYLDGSIKNYVLLPLVIYILKEKIASYTN
jgi:hypothetical protein